jgi:hypothetical protein
VPIGSIVELTATIIKMCSDGGDLSRESCAEKTLAEFPAPRSYAPMIAAIFAYSADLHLSFTQLPIRVYFFLGIAALVALFLLFFFVVSLRERQYLIGDVEPASEPYPYSPTRYWTFTRQDAFKAGWRHVGDFATKKDTTMVKGLLSLFLNPDGTVITAIFSGSTAGAKLHKTVLRSRLANGIILESCDNFGMSDPTHTLSQATLMNADVVELSAFHEQRLQEAASNPVIFTLDNAFAEYEKMTWERGARWVEQGLARWVEPQQVSIRGTVRGALLQIKSLSAKTRAASEQQKRSTIKRAGSRPGDQ